MDQKGMNAVLYLLCCEMPAEQNSHQPLSTHGRIRRSESESLSGVERLLNW